MSSSLPEEHSSDKHGRRTLLSDARKKPSINSRGLQGSGELNSQTKNSRMKLKRPDMPLYVPRGRRLQEELTETQCPSKHISPGRQKVKRLNAQPSEGQNKKLPENNLIRTHQTNRQCKSNSDLEKLNSAVEPILSEGSSCDAVDKSPCEMEDSSATGHVMPQKVDFKSVCSLSDASLENKCVTSSDGSVHVSFGNVEQLWGISNNSVVKPFARSNEEVERGNSKFSNQTSTDQSVTAAHNDGVSSNCAASLVPLNTLKVNMDIVSHFNMEETSVPFANEDTNAISIPNELDKVSGPLIEDAAEVFAHIHSVVNSVSERMSENVRIEEIESIVAEKKLNDRLLDKNISSCSVLTTVSDNNNRSLNEDFECNMETSHSTVAVPQMENETVEKRTIVESLLKSFDSVEVITSETISSKESNDCQDEDVITFNSNCDLNMQNVVSKFVSKESVLGSPSTCKNSLTSSNDTDSLATVSVDISSESALPSMPAILPPLPEITVSAVSENHAKPHKGVEVSEEKKVFMASEKVQSDDDFESSLEVDSWDTMFDDNGECLNPEVLSELIAAVGEVEIKTSKNDYTEYRPLESTVDEEFGNVIEIYGFPLEFNTQDLMSAFSCFRNQDFTIKWVDDSHALGIFSGAFAASEALALQHPYVKVRPLSQGIKESKLKARRCAEHLLPYKPRPATSATLARRLVTGALGLKSNVSKEQRETERLAIKQARDRKRQVAKQRQDIWDGIVS